MDFTRPTNRTPPACCWAIIKNVNAVEGEDPKAFLRAHCSNQGDACAASIANSEPRNFSNNSSRTSRNKKCDVEKHSTLTATSLTCAGAENIARYSNPTRKAYAMRKQGPPAAGTPMAPSNPYALRWFSAGSGQGGRGQWRGESMAIRGGRRRHLPRGGGAVSQQQYQLSRGSRAAMQQGHQGHQGHQGQQQLQQWFHEGGAPQQSRRPYFPGLPSAPKTAAAAAIAAGAIAAPAWMAEVRSWRGLRLRKQRGVISEEGSAPCWCPDGTCVSTRWVRLSWARPSRLLCVAAVLRQLRTSCNQYEHTFRNSSITNRGAGKATPAC